MNTPTSETHKIFAFDKEVNAVYFFFLHQRKYWNQSLVAEENLFTIRLDKSAGKCNCQLRVFMLPAYKPVHVRKLYFYKLISFSVLALSVNVKIFDRKFEGISFLTCESTETGAVMQCDITVTL